MPNVCLMHFPGISMISEDKAGWHTLKYIMCINKRVDMRPKMEDEEEHTDEAGASKLSEHARDSQEDGEPFVWRVHEINESMRDLVDAVPFPKVRPPTKGRPAEDLLCGFKFRDAHANADVQATIAELRQRHGPAATPSHSQTRSGQPLQQSPFRPQAGLAATRGRTRSSIASTSAARTVHRSGLQYTLGNAYSHPSTLPGSCLVHV